MATPVPKATTPRAFLAGASLAALERAGASGRLDALPFAQALAPVGFPLLVICFLSTFMVFVMGVGRLVPFEAEGSRSVFHSTGSLGNRTAREAFHEVCGRIFAWFCGVVFATFLAHLWKSGHLQGLFPGAAG